MLPRRITLLICWAFVVVPAFGQPFHDAIPKEFLGTFGPNLAACKDENGVDLIDVLPNEVHYYEGDDYLLIRVAFNGASTKSGRQVPLFNGRFTGRSETRLLGEMNVRMEMETPDILIRYRLKPDGKPESEPADTWVRCPAS